MAYIRVTIFLAASLCIVQTADADWLRFRGPNGSGISSEADATPTEWSPEKLKWKAEIPGPGSSCPIVVGENVFVTCWTGYGTDEAKGADQNALRRHLICFDRETGQQKWLKTVEPVLPEDQYRGMFAEHGYASHTPVSDGGHVFAFFGKSGVVAFDMNGNQLWQTSVGTELGARDWGSASSPILYKDLVIVPATAESKSIVALEKATGKEVWKAEAAEFNSTWGSPLLVLAEDRTDVVLAIPGEMRGLNADTGKLVWYSEAVPAASMCSSAVVDQNGVIYAMESGPSGGGGVAIRAGGSKDVTKSHTVWSGDQSNQIASPVVFEGKLYSVSNKIVTCLDAATGKLIYEKRLNSKVATGSSEGRSGGGRRRGRGRRGGRDYGSPILADGKIYFTSRAGETFVIQTGEKFKQLAANRVTMDAEDFSSTPAISGGNLFIRSSKNLYCVGN